MKKIKNYTEYLLALVLSYIIRIIPLKLALAFGRFIGYFVFYILKIRRQVAIENIGTCFPDKNSEEINKIALQTYLNFGQTIVEFIRQPFMSRQYLSEKITILNEDLFNGLFSQSKGAICVSGHFGNWEIMGAAIRAKGYSVVVVARDQRNELVNNLINDQRHAVGIETIQLGVAVRGVLKSLHQHKIVALLGDQDAHDEGVFVDFMGRPSSTAPGIALFALKTRCPMIFFASVRGNNGQHTGYFKEIDFSDLEGASKENIRILTQRHASALEEFNPKIPGSLVLDA